jgi:hypothetical protein
LWAIMCKRGASVHDGSVFLRRGFNKGEPVKISHGEFPTEHDHSGVVMRRFPSCTEFTEDTAEERISNQARRAKVPLLQKI